MQFCLKKEWVQAEVIKCILLYIYKTTRVQKSQSTDIFCLFVCFGGSIWTFHLTNAANSLSDRQEGKQRDYNQTFIKPVCLSVCLQSGTLCSRETRGNIEKYDIRSGQHGSRDPGGEALGGGDVHLGARPSSFWFFWPSPIPHSRPENTLCASYFLLFCHHNMSATVVNAFPKSIHFEKKKLAHSRRRFFCLFF